MLEIHFVEKELTNAATQITWCVDRETLNKMQEKGWKDPAIVVVIRPTNTLSSEHWETQKETRHVFRFKDGLGFVNLHCKGENQISAFLFENQGNAKRTFLTRAVGNFTTNLLDHETGEFLKIGERLDVAVSEQLLFEVPDGIFAPEPAQWKKDWVLWLLSDKGVDQCAFRKRQLFAFTVQPFILLLKEFLVLLFTLFSFLIGSKGFSIRFLLHPVRFDMNDVINGETLDDPGIFDGGSFFVRPGKIGWLPLLISPIPVLIVGITAFFHAWKPVGIFFGILFAIILLIVFFANVEKIFPWFGRKIFAFVGWFLEKIDTTNTIGENEDVEILICTGEVKVPRKKSVKLRFLDLKSKVCRPFSR